LDPDAALVAAAKADPEAFVARGAADPFHGGPVTCPRPRESRAFRLIGEGSRLSSRRPAPHLAVAVA
jgi:hypothetical protein